MRRLANLLAAIALGALLVPSLADAASGPPAPRPHSRVVTYDRDGLLVTRLRMDVSRTGRHLVGSVRATVLNTTGHTVRRTLQVGRCRAGLVSAPSCPPTMRVTFSVAAHATRAVSHGFRVRQPPPRQDSVEAAVVPPGAPIGPRLLSHANAELLLKGSAWRGASAGEQCGVQGLDATSARRLAFDVPAVSPTRSYMDVVWTGAAAPSTAATSLSRCTDGTCTPQPLRPARQRSAAQRFGTRTDVDIDGADALRLSAAQPDGTPLFQADLPWPG